MIEKNHINELWSVFLKRLLFFLFLFIFSANANYKLDEFTLNNGLRVILIERKSVPIISFSIWYKCGSKCDTPSRSGVAHFLEHLAFLNHKQELSNYLEDIGANKNAFTSLNSMCFYEIFPKDCLEKVLSYESRRMKNLKIEESVFQNEKKAILEVRGMRIDADVSGKYGESFLAQAFNRQIGGISIIGWKHEISSITIEDLQDFYKKWIVPNNATIIAVGDFDKNSIKQLIEKYFGPIPSSDLPKLNYSAQLESIPKLIQSSSVKNGPSSTVEYIFKMPFSTNKNLRKSLAFELALDVIRQPSFFVNSLLKQMNDIATSFAFSYIDNYYQHDCLFVTFETSSIDKLDTVETTWKYLKKKIAQGCIQEADLNKIKKRKLISLAYKKEDIENISNYFGWLIMSGLSTKDILTIDDIIQSITVQECNDVLKEVFSLSPICTMKTFPRGYDRD